MTSFKSSPASAESGFQPAGESAGQPQNFRADVNLHAELLGSDNPAYQDIYEQARQKGFDHGIEEARVECNRKLQLLEELIGEMQYPMQLIDEQVETEIARLAMAIAKQIVQREFHFDSGRVVTVVKEAIAALPGGQSHIAIRVNPNDIALVQGIFAKNGETSHFELIEDPAVSRGGCKVNTEFAEVDATVETQLNSIMNQLLGGMRAND